MYVYSDEAERQRQNSLIDHSTSGIPNAYCSTPELHSTSGLGRSNAMRRKTHKGSSDSMVTACLRTGDTSTTLTSPVDTSTPIDGSFDNQTIQIVDDCG